MAQSDNGGQQGAALAKLLNQLNLPTLLVILFMQGSNWWETKSGNDFNAHEIQRATQEIHDLYPKLMEALRNQQDMIRSNTEQLKNQNEMLDNQKRLLDAVKANQQRFLEQPSH